MESDSSVGHSIHGPEKTKPQPTVKLQHVELLRRPLRGRGAGPTHDAAGVATTQMTGQNPVKGKGNPPPNQKEWAFHPGKHFIPGKSFTSSMSTILKHDERRDAAPLAAAARPSVRLYDRSYEANLAGGGVSVLTPPEVSKPIRRLGTAGPRTERVLGTLPEDATAAPTYALLGTARRDVFVVNRPTSAPACVLLSKLQTRAGYEAARGNHTDVLQYRHSGGICPPDYRLVADRPAQPQLSPPPSQQARSSFFDSASAYQANKMRSHMSNVITAH
ncbi:hypothetical protein GPECTOR_8g206 [Gonium pectorale]|uniref:Uncharacterized protein n=1 Tax=Gonium pectorale TaxID=33097 RepID=A0A150GSY0_GONPE|nr:hypothetical protein GPECTOR_8g206 [Gonium pectorale]|eukprot:KXZ52822.1 hypothetical protein GPECTOR_8g206 [Gonium pectorale]